MAYEGGQGLDAGRGPDYAVMQQAQYDPRMYQLYVNLMHTWQQAGGGTFDAYQLSGPGSIYGFWGMLDNITEVGSEKYDGLLAGALQLGDANTDGSVDDADFQALQANYGSHNANWVQGGFSGDGWVNWDDLNLLRQNLKPRRGIHGWSQFAQQALFRPVQHGRPPPTGALEFDGYGVTYASGLPRLSATYGTVNGSTQDKPRGSRSSWGGAAYAAGAGVRRQLLDHHRAQWPVCALRQHHRRGQLEFGRVVGDLPGLWRRQAAVSVGDAHVMRRAPVPIDVNVAGVTGRSTLVRWRRAPGSLRRRPHRRRLGRCPAGLHGQFRGDPAVYPDLAGLAEWPGHQHPDLRLVRALAAALRAPAYDHPDRRRTPHRVRHAGLGQHHRDGGRPDATPCRRAAPQGFRDAGGSWIGDYGDAGL